MNMGQVMGPGPQSAGLDPFDGSYLFLQKPGRYVASLLGCFN